MLYMHIAAIRTDLNLVFWDNIVAHCDEDALHELNKVKVNKEQIYKRTKIILHGILCGIVCTYSQSKNMRVQLFFFADMLYYL